MSETVDLLIGLDVSKDSHAAALAEDGQNGHMRSHGTNSSDSASV